MCIRDSLLSERWTHSRNNHSINYRLFVACTPPVKEMDSLSQQSQHQLHVVCGMHTSCQRDRLTLTAITASIKRCLRRVHLLSERWTQSHNNHGINYTLSVACTPPVREMDSLLQQSQHQLHVVCSTPPVREMDSLSQQSRHQLNVVCGMHTSCQRDGLTLTTITASIKRCLRRVHLLSERWTHSHSNHSID